MVEGVIVQEVNSRIWPNCALYETSMKFGTQVDYTLLMIFSYRAISDLSGEKNGGHSE